jgi:hypothetical protein
MTAHPPLLFIFVLLFHLPVTVHRLFTIHCSLTKGFTTGFSGFIWFAMPTRCRWIRLQAFRLFFPASRGKDPFLRSRKEKGGAGDKDPASQATCDRRGVPDAVVVDFVDVVCLASETSRRQGQFPSWCSVICRRKRHGLMAWQVIAATDLFCLGKGLLGFTSFLPFPFFAPRANQVFNTKSVSTWTISFGVAMLQPRNDDAIAHACFFPPFWPVSVCRRGRGHSASWSPGTSDPPLFRALPQVGEKPCLPVSAKTAQVPPSILQLGRLRWRLHAH